MLLDDVMPRYDFHEVHSILVDAPPDRIVRALRDLRQSDVPLAQLLFDIRSLPARVMGKRSLDFRDERPLLEQMLAGGFILMAEAPDQELVLGLIGQFWKVSSNMLTDVRTAEAFLSFDRPDYAKAALNFSVATMDSPGRYRLRTETRICIPDRRARRKFALYWRVIQPGSALIRRAWLLAVKRKAERL